MKRISSVHLVLAKLKVAALTLLLASGFSTSAFANPGLRNEDPALVNRVKRVSSTLNTKVQREAPRMDPYTLRDAESSLMRLARILNVDTRGYERDPAYRVRLLSDKTDMRIQNDGNYLTRRELMDSLDELQNLSGILSGDTRPEPPQPRPPQPPPPRPPPPMPPPPRPEPPRPPRPEPPMPPRPPQYGEVSVRGAIENSSFEFRAATLEQLHEQCTSYYNSYIRGASVDDIVVSVNYGSSQRYHNAASYWRTSTEVCGKILSATQEVVRLPVSDRHAYIVSGTIEGLPYVFKGRDRIDINYECERFYNANRPGSVDDIQVAVNYGQMYLRHNAASYWRTSFEVCQEIIAFLR